MGSSCHWCVNKYPCFREKHSDCCQPVFDIELPPPLPRLTHHDLKWVLSLWQVILTKGIAHRCTNVMHCTLTPLTSYRNGQKWSTWQHSPRIGSVLFVWITFEGGASFLYNCLTFTRGPLYQQQVMWALVTNNISGRHFVYGHVVK